MIQVQLGRQILLTWNAIYLGQKNSTCPLFADLVVLDSSHFCYLQPGAGTSKKSRPTFGMEP